MVQIHGQMRATKKMQIYIGAAGIRFAPLQNVTGIFILFHGMALLWSKHAQIKTAGFYCQRR
jgi:hypothetical protein